MAGAVNPYTFVPHTVQLSRGKPAGHARLQHDRFLGTLRLGIRVRTPLLIGGFRESETDADGDLPTPPRRVSDGMVIIPGSGLLGAVRSVHEVIAGGCMRVLDENFVPVHRAALNSDTTKDLRLAVVLEVNEHGLPTGVTPCSEWVWIDSRLLSGHPMAPLRTGDRLDIPESAIEGRGAPRPKLRPRGRRADGTTAGVHASDIVRRSGLTGNVDKSWALLITSTQARQGADAFFVAGKVDDGTVLEIPRNVRRRLAVCVEGADDLRPSSREKAQRQPGDHKTPQFEPVTWPPSCQPDDPDCVTIGARLRVGPRLHVGQPVWIRRQGAKVAEIRLSQVWRYQGEGSVGERLGADRSSGDSARPCTSWESLCPSCRVFGSAGTDDRDDSEAARQHSYRGHVRVDDVPADFDLDVVPRELAKLESPKPSAGQFYLDHAKFTHVMPLASNIEQPASHWGSLADTGKPRPIRGRKFYWRTKEPDAGDHPRGRARPDPDHGDKQTRRVNLIPAESTFTGRVTFDNLSVAEIGGLVAALDPRRLWETEDVVTSVGGGKPFGFGSVTIDVAVERLDSAISRYVGGESGDLPTLSQCVAEFRNGWNEDAADQCALRNVLTLGYVEDAAVWYPPGGGSKGEASYDQSFEFFQMTTGLETRDERRRLVPLPSPLDEPSAQVVHPNVERKPRNPR